MNKQVLLAERPVGMPTDSTWTYQTTKIPKILDGKDLEYFIKTIKDLQK